MRLMAAEASPRAEETVNVSFLKFSGSDMSFPSVKPTFPVKQSNQNIYQHK